jgi:hypothetical protein
MKLMKDLATKQIQNDVSEDKLVHFFLSSKGYLPIDPPQWASVLSCPFCGCKTFFICIVDIKYKAWGCGIVCDGSKLPSSIGGGYIQATSLRCIEWPLFCEINGIGDLHHDVRFENVQQSRGKLDYMIKFSSNPFGVLLMQGNPGTGKTYAAMAICEYYTRKSNLCIFTTQKRMANHWIISLSDPVNNYCDSLNNTRLLVIDDFGTGEPNPKFLEFFMELINNRLQWSNRGTVITSNLKDTEFIKFCGHALSDRLFTGQKFVFEGESRRKKTIL